ncbi:MAG: hypothetical protein A2Z34_09795 [Planctomycetes bacterium RBG_16_59_8]|nr:MAG: hypothetical protein A2Z34_09795 [Planctomycetes bacterium RBG_16_59_8]
MSSRHFVLAAALLFLAGCDGEGEPAPRNDEPPRQLPPKAASPAIAVELGAAWLARQQRANGAWLDPGGKESVGLTAFAATLLARAHTHPEHLRRACLFLRQFFRKGELAMDQRWFYTGYEVPLVMLAFWHADRREYAPEIAALLRYLRNTRIVAGDKTNPRRRDWHIGSWEYSSVARIPPDISVTAFVLDALAAVDPAGSRDIMEEALPYVQRCQNRKASSGMKNSLDDGGFKHEPVAGKAASLLLENGEYGFLSYGSVTCDGLRCYLLAGTSPDDPRVSAAIEWLRAHYRLDENPNVAALQATKEPARRTCMLYYLFSLARCLSSLADEPAIPGAQWRKELAERIVALQASDGSWRNPDGMMWEEYPPLATCLMLNALLTMRPHR